MASLGRNALVEALRTHLEARLAGTVRTVTRRTRDPAPEEMPCLVVGATTEQTNDGDVDLPDWTLRVGCYLFVRENGNEGPVPTVLAICDAIEDALKRPSTETHGGYWTNLGGAAWYARPLSVDSLPDMEAADGGLAVMRVEIRAKPTR
jgi:hypothetical protein